MDSEADSTSPSMQPQSEMPEVSTNPTTAMPKSIAVEPSNPPEICMQRFATNPLTGTAMLQEKLEELTSWALLPNYQLDNELECTLGGLMEYAEAGAMAFHTTNQMKSLLHLPIKWKIDVKWAITVNWQQNAQAIQAFMRGDAANPACISCSKGSGPFPICVTVAGCLCGMCASCHYGGEGSRCSFCKPHKFYLISAGDIY
jgi:hypothetical protein